MKTVVTKSAITLAFVAGLALPTLAQQCPTGNFSSPNGSMQRFTTPTGQCRTLPTCPTTTVSPAAPRPTRTAGGTPIRYVDVPVPSYANCPGQNGYGYGYGYGPNGFGYGYGVGGFNYSQTNVSASTAPQQGQAARQEVPQAAAAAAPDPRTANSHQMRKALNKFARENSVGGKLYLRAGSSKWLLSYHGQPKYQPGLAVVPCRGRDGKGQEQDVTLTLFINGDEVTVAEVAPQG